MYYLHKATSAVSGVKQMLANEKRRYVMTLDFRQYIAEYTVANFWHYPIRRRVTYASALEWSFTAYTQTKKHVTSCQRVDKFTLNPHKVDLTKIASLQ